MPSEGASILLPSTADLKQFSYHAENKQFLDVSTGRRVGQWPGTAEGSRDDIGGGRLRVGYVTSGVNRARRGGRKNRGKVLFVPGHHAIGLVGTDGLEQIMRRSCGGKKLVLFRNPGSDLLRPAFLHVIYG